MIAEVTLLDDGHQGVDIPRIVGTRGKAIFTANTSMFIDDDDPILLFPGCLDRTIDDAGWMVALIAKGRKEMACDIWILTFLNNLHP